MAEPREKGERFLRAVQEPGAIAQPVCAVFAHPDDESIGLGAQLPRLTNLWLVVVTDGAPRSGHDATRAGFPTPAAYAQARAGELREVLRIAGVSEERLIRFEVPDQEAPLRLQEIVDRLARLFSEKQPEVVITHAFEGGHPDHDACAFAVHAACRKISERERPAVVEVPLYRLGSEGRVPQQFAPMPGRREVSVALSPEQQALKRRLFEAHASQREVLGWFSTETERFGLAPSYDFTVLPNGGRVLYDTFGWAMNGARWQGLARQALDRLEGTRAA